MIIKGEGYFCSSPRKEEVEMRSIIVIIGLVSMGVMDGEVKKEWEIFYGGGSYEGGGRVIKVLGGSVYMVGTGKSDLRSYMVIGRYGVSGDVVWEVLYYNDDWESVDYGWDMEVDDEGNVYAVCRSFEFNTGRVIFVTVKYDGGGVLRWERFYGGECDRSLVEGIELYGGYVYVCGWSDGVTYGDTSEDYCVVKYSEAGDEEWVRRYNGRANGRDEVRGMVVDDEGNVYVTGESELPEGGDEFVTIKYSKEGDEIWIKRDEGADVHDIATDKRGNVYITGNVITEDKHSACVLIKYGHHIFSRIFEKKGYRASVGNAIEVDKEVNIYVVGTIYSDSTLEDILTVKYDSLGGEEWVRVRDIDSFPQYGSDVCVDDEGNVYVGGNGESEMGDEAVIIKYNREGVEEWIIREHGFGLEDMEIDEEGNIYITGSKNGKVCTIKYSQGEGVDEKDIKENKGDIAITEQGRDYIEFEVSYTGYADIRIYDIQGRKVGDIYSGYVDGKKTISYNWGDLSKGVYFIRLRTEDKESCKKVIKVK